MSRGTVSQFARCLLIIVGTVVMLCDPALAGNNGASRFPDPASDETVPSTSTAETAVLARGCFWGIQAVFQHVKGVVSATSGYAGGSTKNPNYEQVSSGRTGHAESVKIVYDLS
jgi:peptide-methionine (S)-S-oxide reductase